MFLTEKLKQDSRLKWSASDSNNLKEIISEIKSRPLLYYPDLNKSFTLLTDASDLAVGAVLQQENKTIGIFSHKLSKSEKNYTIAEKKAFAIIKVLEFFRNLILLSKVIIKTDNQNILGIREVNRRVQRWKLLIEEINYELVKIPGNKNSAADNLSRIYMSIAKPYVKNIMHHKDRIGRIENKRFISFNEISKLHLQLQHPGQKAFLSTIKSNFHHPKLQKIVQSITQSCQVCQRAKHFLSNKFLSNLKILSSEPLEYVSSDILGPLKREHFKSNINKKYFYIVTFTDIYSKWTEIDIIWDITSETIMHSFESKWIKRFGAPRKFYQTKAVNTYLQTSKLC
ncbi:Transposon Tf2-11 polyprotein [Dictyocoela muelleri]|nr:Transposon Tf2-11 polyprotein [Dictyocoela muelleri]